MAKLAFWKISQMVFLLDAFQKYVDTKLVEIPFEINENNVYDVKVPEWVKNIGYWWLEGNNFQMIVFQMQ